MHELPLTKSILDCACLYAQKADAKKVVTIVVALGVMRDIKKEWLQRYFGYVSKGTVAEGADILIESIPASYQCLRCGEVFPVAFDHITNSTVSCPACGMQDYKLVTGSEFQIQGIEVV